MKLTGEVGPSPFVAGPSSRGKLVLSTTYAVSSNGKRFVCVCVCVGGVIFRSHSADDPWEVGGAVWFHMMHFFFQFKFKKKKLNYINNVKRMFELQNQRFKC